MKHAVIFHLFLEIARLFFIEGRQEILSTWNDFIDDEKKYNDERI